MHFANPWNLGKLVLLEQIRAQYFQRNFYLYWQRILVLAESIQEGVEIANVPRIKLENIWESYQVHF
jgi:hypothetical protein